MGMSPFYERKPSKYDSVEFTLPLNSTNYDLGANQAAWHANVKEMYGCVQIITSQTVGIKFNSTANPTVTITSSQSPFLVDFLQVSNMFLTNTTAADMKILAVKN